MKKVILLACALAVSFAAAATPPEPKPKRQQPSNAAIAAAVAAIKLELTNQATVDMRGANMGGQGGSGGKVDLAGAKMGGEGGQGGQGGSVNVPKTAASAASVYGSAPANDTCQPAGKGGSLQVTSFGFSLTGAGDSLESCEARADSVNLAYTQADPAVIKARQCMSPKMKQAFADAGQPCPEPKQAAATPQAQSTVATTIADYQGDDPYIRARLAKQGGQ